MSKKSRQLWLTTGAIARHCHVTPETVANWIKRGQMQAGTTPGGHYRVPVNEMVRFCKSHGFEVLPEWEETNKPPTVMIIDDDKAFVKSLIPAFEQPGRKVVGTSDLAEAGLSLLKYQPEVVILDLHMPGSDGIKIAEMLREDRELNKTKILILSGNITTENREILESLHVDRIHEKPPNLRNLVNDVNDLLEEAFS